MPEDVITQPLPVDAKWPAGSIRIMSQAVSASEISTRPGISADEDFERSSLMSPQPGV
ncbi:hypothetical protein [Streptomyces sp. JV178]|uniref:hypothetical protein n=1 Tax=Streptomyces sp. JV178 TaxID=858632 RepID=UPI0015D53680|nr:hypothetical protein [Streptomyces sp. JV178]